MTRRWLLEYFSSKDDDKLNHKSRERERKVTSHSFPLIFLRLDSFFSSSSFFVDSIINERKNQVIRVIILSMNNFLVVCSFLLGEIENILLLFKIDLVSVLLRTLQDENNQRRLSREKHFLFFSKMNFFSRWIENK